jgi:hypothetical protein
MLNKTSGTLSASGDISSAFANAITAMPTQTNRNKDLLTAFADILATSSETAAWTGSEGMPKTQVAAKPQSASGPGNRTASVAHASAETATQAPGTEQMIPAYALRMNEWVMPNPEDTILTMNSALPSETSPTASSVSSPSVVDGEVRGPQASNQPATTPTNVTFATSTALSSSLPMSRRDVSSAGLLGNGFRENTLPVAEASNRQPVTTAEFEPSPVEAFISPSVSRSSFHSSTPKVTSQNDLALKAFAGNTSAAVSDSNRPQSTSTEFAPLPISNPGGPHLSQELSVGTTAATLTANPPEFAEPTIFSTPTPTLSSTQVSQKTVQGPTPAPSNTAQESLVPVGMTAGEFETDTLAEALGNLLRRFSASSITSTVISNAPSVVTTTSTPVAVQTDLVTSDLISASEPTKAAPTAAPVQANPNPTPLNSIDTPGLRAPAAFDASSAFLRSFVPPSDFPTVAISYEQNSEKNRPATSMTAVSSTLSAPDAAPTDALAQALSVAPILTPIVSQAIAQGPTETVASSSISMTPTVSTSTERNTLLEASPVLKAMVAQTVDAALTQATRSAPHAPAYAAEQMVAPTVEPTTPMAASPFITATATSTSTAPQQKAPSQNFAISPKVETPAPAPVTPVPQPTAPSVASLKIPFVLTPTVANSANLTGDNSTPSNGPATTSSLSLTPPVLSSEKPVWGIATNTTASDTPVPDATSPVAPAAFNQDSGSQTDTTSHSPNYWRASSTESATTAAQAPASVGTAALAGVASISSAPLKPDGNEVVTGSITPTHNASGDAQLPSSVLVQRASEGHELSAALQSWNGGDNAQTRLVQAAHLGGNLRESEMNISMQAESLGSVELHARVSGDVVGAAIGVERHDAHTMISNNISSLHDALQERQLRLGSVTVFQSPVHSGATAGDGGNSQQRGTGPRQSASTGWTAPQSSLSPTEATAPAESSEGNVVFDSNGRLSVRA